MAITTYDELKTAVANWLHRSDLTSRIPEFISLGESHLNRNLRVREMEYESTLTLSTVNPYVSLPTGFLEAISIVDDQGESLVPLSSDILAREAYWANSERPQYYRIGSRIDFERIPNSAYAFKMRHYKRLDLDTDLTNDVLTQHPDLYLYSALLTAEPFIMNDARLPTWAAMLERAMNDANYRSSRNIRTLRTDVSATGSLDILRG